MKYIKHNILMEEGSKTKIVGLVPTQESIWIDRKPCLYPLSEERWIKDSLFAKNWIKRYELPKISIKRRVNYIVVKESNTAGYPIPYFVLVPKTEMGKI